LTQYKYLCIILTMMNYNKHFSLANIQVIGSVNLWLSCEDDIRGSE